MNCPSRHVQGGCERIGWIQVDHNHTSRTGQILALRRKELGLTQMMVASEIGIPTRVYQRFEYGERKVETCSLRLGLKLCAILQLDPYELLSYGEPHYL